MKVFVDTSAFYAVLDADDLHHEAAHEAWSRLLGNVVSLHTSNYILVETHALLQHRIGLEAVRRFTADVLPILKVFYVNETAHRMALHSLLTAQRRQLSLVDCVSFDTMRTLGIDCSFCFDPHFREQGFDVIPESPSEESSNRACRAPAT